MPVENEFGRLSAEQLLKVVGWFPAVDSIASEIQKTFLANPDRTARLAPKGFRWSGAYELSLDEHLAQLVILMGRADFVLAAARSEDPAQIILDGLERSETTDDGELNSAIFGESHTFAYFVGLLLGLLHSFESVAIYGRYIHEFIAEARSSHPGRDKSLLNAIRIDPSVVSGPTAAKRISTAIAMDDQVFLAELRLAMEGKTGDQVAYLRKFRKAIKLISESGGLGSSPTALARRLVELGIAPGGLMAVKNAAERIRKAQKGNAI